MITPEKQRNSILHKVEELQRKKFWGELNLVFKDGELKLAVVRSTIPVEKLCVEAEEIVFKVDCGVNRGKQAGIDP